MRCRSWASWLLFTVAASASLYTHFLAAIPLAGYGLYTIVLHDRDRQIQRGFFTAAKKLLEFIDLRFSADRNRNTKL